MIQTWRRVLDIVMPFRLRYAKDINGTTLVVCSRSSFKWHFSIISPRIDDELCIRWSLNRHLTLMIHPRHCAIINGRHLILWQRKREWSLDLIPLVILDCPPLIEGKQWPGRECKSVHSIHPYNGLIVRTRRTGAYRMK